MTFFLARRCIVPFVVAISVCACVAYEPTPPPEPPPTPLAQDAGSHNESPPSCVCADVVETTLPGAGFGDVVVLCTACDSSCDTLGAACDEYGAACDNGGVCISCCDGASGALRCTE